VSCPDFELLSAHADGESTAGERVFLEKHLPSCSRCRETLQGLRAEKAGLRRLPLPPVPEALLADLESMAAGYRPCAEGIWARFFAELRAGLRHPAAVFALAAAVCLGLVLWGRGRGLLTPHLDVSVDVLTAAHGQYELTLPLAPSERILSEMPQQLAVGWPAGSSRGEEGGGVY